MLTGLTDILYDPGQPELVRQSFAGVLPAHRGRSVAKWLKAAMLRLVRERLPGAQRIATANAE